MLDDKDEFDQPHEDWCNCDTCEYLAFSRWADRQDSYNEPVPGWLFVMAATIIVWLILFGR